MGVTFLRFARALARTDPDTKVPGVPLRRVGGSCALRMALFIAIKIFQLGSWSTMGLPG